MPYELHTRPNELTRQVFEVLAVAKQRKTLGNETCRCRQVIMKPRSCQTKQGWSYSILSRKPKWHVKSLIGWSSTRKARVSCSIIILTCGILLSGLFQQKIGSKANPYLPNPLTPTTGRNLTSFNSNPTKIPNVHPKLPPHTNPLVIPHIIRCLPCPISSTTQRYHHQRWGTGSSRDLRTLKRWW